MSEQIAASMDRPVKVEERLFNEAQKARLAQQKREREAEENARKSARPEISEASRAIAQGKREGADVVERLMKYQKDHSMKQKEFIEKASEDKDCTFAPHVNSELNKELLLKRAQRSQPSTRGKVESDSCSFRPKIEKNSIKLAGKLVTSPAHL